VNHARPDEAVNHTRPDEAVNHTRPDEAVNHARPDEAVNCAREGWLQGMPQVEAYPEAIRPSPETVEISTHAFTTLRCC